MRRCEFRLLQLRCAAHRDAAHCDCRTGVHSWLTDATARSARSAQPPSWSEPHLHRMTPEDALLAAPVTSTPAMRQPSRSPEPAATQEEKLAVVSGLLRLPTIMGACVKSLLFADAREHARTHARVLFIVPLLSLPHIARAGARAFLLARFSNLTCTAVALLYPPIAVLCTSTS